MQLEVAEFTRGANIGAGFGVLKLAILGDPVVGGGIVGCPAREVAPVEKRGRAAPGAGRWMAGVVFQRRCGSPDQLTIRALSSEFTILDDQLPCAWRWAVVEGKARSLNLRVVHRMNAARAADHADGGRATCIGKFHPGKFHPGKFYPGWIGALRCDNS